MNTDDNINKANCQLSDKQTERPKLHHNEMVNYITPKLPKESNWGRPVINSINCHVSEISRFVGHYLQPLAKEIPSYIKAQSYFVKKINNLTVLEDLTLVTMDAKPLSASIPNDEGIVAVKRGMITNKTIPTKITTF